MQPLKKKSCEGFDSGLENADLIKELEQGLDVNKKLKKNY